MDDHSPKYSETAILLSMMTHRLETLETALNEVRALLQSTREHQILLNPKIETLRIKLEEHAKAIEIIDSIVVTRKTLKVVFGAVVSIVGALVFIASTFDQLQRWFGLSK